MKNKSIFIIKTHSYLDIITNSSTELFVLYTDKSLEMVREIIVEKEKEFPCEYGEHFYINYDNPYYYGECPVDDVEEAVKYLRLIGYKIEAPEVEKEPRAIIISCERGCMNRNMVEFIEETFNTKLDDY